MKNIIVNTFFTAALLMIAVCPVVSAGEAMDQLQDMENTGVSFDGSDGKRSGMDIDLTEVEVAIPEPTAVPVDEDN